MSVDTRISNSYPGANQGAAWTADKTEPYSRVTLKSSGFAPETPPKEALFNFIRILRLGEGATAADTVAAEASQELKPGDYHIRRHGGGPYIAVDPNEEEPRQVKAISRDAKPLKVSAPHEQRLVCDTK